MIISASYKTDIPAFYGAWFMARLDAGRCRMVNPYGGQRYDVPLDRDSVTGFVFWTKNIAPFLAPLAAVAARGYPFTVQFGINGYPRALEASVPAPDRTVADLRTLARRYGKRVAVWRYDPVVFSSLTPAGWHEANFAGLARRLGGATDEVVISFAHVYRKTRRNLDEAAGAAGFDWRDPPDDEKRALAARLAEIAADNAMALTVCAQPELMPAGVAAARCIDVDRLGDVAGRTLAAPVKGNRPGCECAQSRDIGDYDTCPHGCVYCYAVSDPARARARFRAHDPRAPGLHVERPPVAGVAGAPDGRRQSGAASITAKPTSVG